MEEGTPDQLDLQTQIDAIVRQISANRRDIDALADRAAVAEARADDAEVRELIDRDMISELQRDGILSAEHSAQMEEALRSSRTIGAAVGMIMASRNVPEADAFDALRKASQDSNRKLRELAAELVVSAGSVDGAHPAR